MEVQLLHCQLMMYVNITWRERQELPFYMWPLCWSAKSNYAIRSCKLCIWLVMPLRSNLFPAHCISL